MSRVQLKRIKEVVLATDPNMTGEATAAYPCRSATRTGSGNSARRGLPVGGSLEYADEVTLGRALTQPWGL